MPRPDKCRICGCTQNNACEQDGGGCAWIAPGLCSACRLPAKLRTITRNSPAADRYMVHGIAEAVSLFLAAGEIEEAGTLIARSGLTIRVIRATKVPRFVARRIEDHIAWRSERVPDGRGGKERRSAALAPNFGADLRKGRQADFIRRPFEGIEEIAPTVAFRGKDGKPKAGRIKITARSTHPIAIGKPAPRRRP